MRGRRDRDRMVVKFTTTCAISACYHLSCKFEPRSWQGVLDTQYVIKFDSDLMAHTLTNLIPPLFIEVPVPS
jgi:hypothetical protein